MRPIAVISGIFSLAWNVLAFKHNSRHSSLFHVGWKSMAPLDGPSTSGAESILAEQKVNDRADDSWKVIVDDPHVVDDTERVWEGHMEGFDWELEKARLILEGPSFAPLRMSIWQPVPYSAKYSKPSFLDDFKIVANNAFQMLGMAQSYDGAPLVSAIANYTGGFSELAKGLAGGDLTTLAGGPLFLMLEKYARAYGPVFKLAFGPKSFIVISDPPLIKHVLKDNSLRYDKGILAEILDPIMGKGLIPADQETWKVRRRAIVPGFHKAWLNAMMNLFVRCNEPLIRKLEKAANSGSTVKMETEYCSVALDIIGKAVFNFDFGSVDEESPIVKAVYRTLQEAERRATSIIPYWNLPYASHYLDNLKEFEANMAMLNDVLNDLIRQAMDSADKVDQEELQNRDYNNMENPSLLRFLVDMRGEDASSTQLRDDLMTMLIAGHETTAAALTWTTYELSRQPELAAEVVAEIDRVLGDRDPTYEDMGNLLLTRLCIAETLRMYPQPPLLIRRALVDDVLPKGRSGIAINIPKGTDLFISSWSLHRDPELWESPDKYDPHRFMRDFKNPDAHGWDGFTAFSATSKQMYPSEAGADYAFMPFGGGTRKCVGDQFAMMESVATLVSVLRRFDLSMDCKPEDVGMRTGATIHTENNLPMRISHRKPKSE
jgi:cytochrome P450